MTIRTFLPALLLTLVSVLSASAQDEGEKPLRPVFAAYTAEAGSARLADTYLTPLKYTGWHAGLDYNRYQAMKFSPGKWTMQLHGNLSVDRTDNPVRNATMWSAMLSLEWGMMRRWQPDRKSVV